MDALAALRLQLEWGVDEALAAEPVDRFRPPAELIPALSPALPAAPARPRSALVGEAASAQARSLAAQADTPAALREAIASFDPDGLAATATSLVLSDGAAGLGLVVIGDIPGADEDRAGVPFSGAGGRLLDRMLASIGLDRRQVLLTTVLPWRPPGGRPASETELATYAPFLHRHLALLGPRRLLLLGAVATRAMLGREATLARLRGRWHEANIDGLAVPVPALPSLLPAQLLARPELKSIAWADLRLLRRTCDSDNKE